jgi:hypothetical protein
MPRSVPLSLSSQETFVPYLGLSDSTSPRLRADAGVRASHPAIEGTTAESLATPGFRVTSWPFTSPTRRHACLEGTPPQAPRFTTTGAAPKSAPASSPRTLAKPAPTSPPTRPAKTSGRPRGGTRPTATGAGRTPEQTQARPSRRRCRTGASPWTGCGYVRVHAAAGHRVRGPKAPELDDRVPGAARDQEGAVGAKPDGVDAGSTARWRERIWRPRNGDVPPHRPSLSLQHGRQPGDHRPAYPCVADKDLAHGVCLGRDSTPASLTERGCTGVRSPIRRLCAFRLACLQIQSAEESDASACARQTDTGPIRRQDEVGEGASFRSFPIRGPHRCTR